MIEFSNVEKVERRRRRFDMAYKEQSKQ